MHVLLISAAHAGWVLRCNILRGRSKSTANLLRVLTPGSPSSLGTSGIFRSILAEIGVDIHPLTHTCMRCLLFYFYVFGNNKCVLLWPKEKMNNDFQQHSNALENLTLGQFRQNPV